MDQVTGHLVLHPTFALVDPDGGLHVPNDTYLILINVPPLSILDKQDAAAAANALAADGFQHGERITVHGRAGIVQGHKAIVMEGATRP